MSKSQAKLLGLDETVRENERSSARGGVWRLRQLRLPSQGTAPLAAEPPAERVNADLSTRVEESKW